MWGLYQAERIEGFMLEIMVDTSVSVIGVNEEREWDGGVEVQALGRGCYGLVDYG